MRAPAMSSIVLSLYSWVLAHELADDRREFLQPLGDVALDAEGAETAPTTHLCPVLCFGVGLTPVPGDRGRPGNVVLRLAQDLRVVLSEDLAGALDLGLAVLELRPRHPHSVGSVPADATPPSPATPGAVPRGNIRQRFADKAQT